MANTTPPYIYANVKTLRTLDLKKQCTGQDSLSSSRLENSFNITPLNRNIYITVIYIIFNFWNSDYILGVTNKNVLEHNKN